MTSNDEVSISISKGRHGNKRIRNIIKKAFEAIDVDHSNDLTPEEITLFMRERILEEKIQAIRKKTGVNTHKSLVEEMKRAKEVALNMYAGWDVGVEVEIIHNGIPKIAHIQSIDPISNGRDYEAKLEILSSGALIGPIGISDMKKKHILKEEDFNMDNIDAQSKMRISKYVGDAVYQWMKKQSKKPDIANNAEQFYKRYMFLSKNLIKKADTDGNGSIDIDEFLNAFLEMYDHLKSAKMTLKENARHPLKEYENAYKHLLFAKQSETLGPEGILLNKDTGKAEGEVRVKVIRCENLLPMDFNGSSDPYVTVTLLGDDVDHEVYGGLGMKEWKEIDGANTKLVKEHPSTQKTAVVNDDLNPVFNETLIIKPIIRKGGKIRVAVYDEDGVMNDEFIGQAIIDINSLLEKFANAEDDTENFNGTGSIYLSFDLDGDEVEDDDEKEEYRGKIFLDVNIVYSKIEYYSRIVNSLQRNKDLIVKKVIAAEEELWTLISPFAVGSKDLILANDDDDDSETNMNESHDGLVDVDLTIDTDPLPSLGNLPVASSTFFATPIPAKFFLCGFTAVSILIVLLGIILNNGGVNHFAEISPGEP